jgi:hypothetical protein
VRMGSVKERAVRQLSEFFFLSGVKKKKKEEPTEEPKKSPITEFESADDWMMTMILVGVMHQNPGIDSKEAIRIGKEWAKKIHMPRSEVLWKKQTDRVTRTGIRAQASKIRRELFKLI